MTKESVESATFALAREMRESILSSVGAPADSADNPVLNPDGSVVFGADKILHNDLVPGERTYKITGVIHYQITVTAVYEKINF